MFTLAEPLEKPDQVRLPVCGLLPKKALPNASGVARSSAAPSASLIQRVIDPPIPDRSSGDDLKSKSQASRKCALNQSIDVANDNLCKDIRRESATGPVAHNLSRERCVAPQLCRRNLRNGITGARSA